ncbi:MAG TPA: peptidoglycan editing factor PgeF [Candidatus Nitrosotalea sp.]|nr:peptidoglycan editing factor PgeF [Candidatus Nitrosotalea sp.]
MDIAESSPDWITPDWPAAPSVRALTTLRTGGHSTGPYQSLNLAAHVGDDPIKVERNRDAIQQVLKLPLEPVWLEQVHGVAVIDAADARVARRADGGYTDKTGVACAVLTADCLPLLLCDLGGTEVAALHGGWRGLAAGIVEQGLKRFRSPRHHLLAWLGPAISARYYEVGEEVRQAFTAYGADVQAAFAPSHTGHYYADLYAIARCQLRQGGVRQIHGGTFCTYAERGRFYSHRRDGRGNQQTGRMASLIWIDPASA